MSLKSNNFWKGGPLPADMVLNSPYCGLHRAAGYLARNQLAIGAFAGVQNLNLFQVTGTIELCGIWGTFTDVTNVATLNAASWNLYDGAAAQPITSAAGVAIGGAALGSTISKESAAANALVFQDAVAGSYSECAFNKVFTGGLVVQKVATNTYIRFTVTTDAATNCGIDFWCCWICREPGSLLVAV